MSEPEVKPDKKRRFRWKRWFFGFILLVIALFSLYTWFTLAWSYSTGERAGYVQNFSKRGILFKTWEGELAMVATPGAMPEKFYFSVPRDSIAALINQTLGRRVALVYEQHVGVPMTWFGETGYFVVGVKVIE